MPQGKGTYKMPGRPSKMEKKAAQGKKSMKKSKSGRKRRAHGK